MEYKRYLRAWSIFVLKLTVAAVTLYFVLTLVDVSQLLELFRTARYEYILLGFLLIPLNVGVRVLRWKILVSSLDLSIDWKRASSSVLVGIALGSFTPGEIGDYFGRILHLPDARKSHVIGLTLLDKIQTMLAMALFAVPTLEYLFLNSHWILIAGISVLIVLSIYFFLGTHFSFLVHRFQHTRYVGAISATLFTLHKKHQLKSFILVVSLILVVGVQMYCFLSAFYNTSLIISFLGCSTMLFVKSFVPLSIGDLGIRELTTAYIFSQWLVPMSVSVNAAFLLFVANVFLPACTGVFIFLFTKHKNIWNII